MVDINDDNSIKPLDTVNDFPHVGLMYFENSGENLLRFYLENIFKIQTQTNIRKEFLITTSSNIFQRKNLDINLSWIIPSDYPCREKYEYEPVEIAMAVILIRNPIEVIMSLILKDSFLLEEALNKADEYIKNWKIFYKYWINAPIPCFIVKYEELLEQPYYILKDLCKFILGIKSIEETKLDYSIKRVLGMNIDDKYYAFDVSTKQSLNLSDKILSNFQEKFMVVKNIMKKFKYADDESDNFKENKKINELNSNNNISITNDMINIENIENKNLSWINQFNDENYIKSVELQESIANSVLTSNYFTLRLS
jgi:hypothetical protein